MNNFYISINNCFLYLISPCSLLTVKHIIEIRLKIARKILQSKLYYSILNNYIPLNVFIFRSLGKLLFAGFSFCEVFKKESHFKINFENNLKYLQTLKISKPIILIS